MGERLLRHHGRSCVARLDLAAREVADLAELHPAAFGLTEARRLDSIRRRLEEVHAALLDERAHMPVQPTGDPPPSSVPADVLENARRDGVRSADMRINVGDESMWARRIDARRAVLLDSPATGAHDCNGLPYLCGDLVEVVHDDRFPGRNRAARVLARATTTPGGALVVSSPGRRRPVARLKPKRNAGGGA